MKVALLKNMKIIFVDMRYGYVVSFTGSRVSDKVRVKLSRFERFLDELHEQKVNIPW